MHVRKRRRAREFWLPRWKNLRMSVFTRLQWQISLLGQRFAVGILNYHFGSRQEMLRELMSTQIQHFWSMLSLPQAELKFFEYEAAILKVLPRVPARQSKLCAAGRRDPSV